MPQVKTSTPKVERIGNYVREKNRSLFGSGYRWYDVNLPVGRHYVFLDKEARVGDWILKPNGTKVQVNARGLAPTAKATTTTKKSTISTPKQGNSNSGVNTIDGGQLPEVVVIGKRPKKEGSQSRTNQGRTGGASRNRRTGSPRRNRQGQINIGGGYQEKAYTPETGLNPEIVERVAVQPPQGMAISFPEQITNPTFTAPETIEVPQVNVPGTFTRRDIRNMLRAKGISPYYEIGGLQRRALRRYLNGEPVAGEYQDFINKIMQ